MRGAVISTSVGPDGRFGPAASKWPATTSTNAVPTAAG